MHTLVRYLLVRVASGVAAVAPVAARAQTQPFDVQRIDDGVFAVIRHDPISYVNNSNSLIVIGDSGVLVVDAQFTRLATNQTIAAVRRLTSKPVRYVVNTHWHDDHVAGNQVYADSFPGVHFIAHASTRADLVALGAPNRRGTWDAAAPFTARFERLLGQGLGVDSTPVVPLERATMENTILVGRQYLAEKNGFRETLPDQRVAPRGPFAGTRAPDARRVVSATGASYAGAHPRRDSWCGCRRGRRRNSAQGGDSCRRTHFDRAWRQVARLSVRELLSRARRGTSL